LPPPVLALLCVDDELFDEAPGPEPDFPVELPLLLVEDLA
jgi:hypothetical protein